MPITHMSSPLVHTSRIRVASRTRIAGRTPRTSTRANTRTKSELTPTNPARSSQHATTKATSPAPSTENTSLDWAATLVEQNPFVRRSLAFPVAFVSASNWLAQCIYTAAKLGVPDKLAYGPKTVAQLAEELQVDTDALGRLMRSLAGQGPFPGLFVEVCIGYPSAN
eukprot:4509296-Pyramimonas_sp.AAC.1